MIKVGLIGFGSMGHKHLEIYKRLENEGFPIKLVAIYDVDEQKFHGKSQESNIAGPIAAGDLSGISTIQTRSCSIRGRWTWSILRCLLFCMIPIRSAR